MPKKHKEYLLIGSIFLIGIITMILSIVALSQKLEIPGIYGSATIKEIYNSLDPSAPSIITNTSGMAYIGSIITICGSIGVMFFGGYLIYISIGLKKEILTNKILIISTVLLLIIFALGLASIITSSNITSFSWWNKHAR